ncbi:Phosphoserine phosphatase 1 [Corynebacterium ciconiae DSM 44920]|uniref:bifunctional RNase H/acid phosphatase n=1 Tax=Corynebacterium ciconiae TaxID=227319 RepID=UPI0003750AA5|nr:bifunctional RNase H/acid phosphatase [Corynebacterium ciconiae]WKD60709.1 Phosphoserine phosphatase 1 [Corynebacterium ciconiae DSM 44920]
MKLVIESDGGSRGNPGVAGAGTVVYNATRSRELATVVEYLGSASNNVAEYHGMINGLRVARDLGATEVEVFMDSKLVVQQMSGAWKIKHADMQKLALAARTLAQEIGQVSYHWIPRAKNKRADELSNEAMDLHGTGVKPGHMVLGGEDRPQPRASHPLLATDEPGTVQELPLDPAPSAPETAARWTGASSTPTRLILLRHGQTGMSAKKLYAGQSDAPLNAVGEQQVAAAAQRIAQGLEGEGFYGAQRIDAIVASPLSRAQRSAQILAETLDGPEVEVADCLREMDFGQWDGLSFAEAHERDPKLHSSWLEDSSIAAPGGESVLEADARVWDGVQELIAAHREQTVAVVAHVTPIKAVLRHALGANERFFHRLHLDLASVSVVEFYADGPVSVRIVNLTG